MKNENLLLKHLQNKSCVYSKNDKIKMPELNRILCIYMQHIFNICDNLIILGRYLAQNKRLRNSLKTEIRVIDHLF
jgi:hypothetical protein